LLELEAVAPQAPQRPQVEVEEAAALQLLLGQAEAVAAPPWVPLEA
jgi:hypothetical protein